MKRQQYRVKNVGRVRLGQGPWGVAEPPTNLRRSFSQR